MPPSATAHALDAPPSSGDPARPQGLLEEILLLGGELRAIAYGQLRLAALETRQAGESLVGIIAMGLFAAGLCLSAWLFLVGAAVIELVERGLLNTSAALLLAAAINAVVVLFLVVGIRRRSRRLLLSATVNSLQPVAPKVGVSE